MKATSEKLQELAEAKAKAEQMQKEQLERLRKSANAIFSTEHGKIFARELRAFCQVDKVDVDVNPQNLAYQKGLRNVYLAFVRGLLEPDVLNQIER